MKILIIDDDPISLQASELQFRILGHQILIAQNFPETFDLLEAHYPTLDLVMIDYELKFPAYPAAPDLGTKIAADYPNLILYVLTAYNNSEYIIEALRSRVFSDFLYKDSEMEMQQIALQRAEKLYNLKKALILAETRANKAEAEVSKLERSIKERNAALIEEIDNLPINEIPEEIKLKQEKLLDAQEFVIKLIYKKFTNTEIKKQCLAGAMILHSDGKMMIDDKVIRGLNGINLKDYKVGTRPDSTISNQFQLYSNNHLIKNTLYIKKLLQSYPNKWESSLQQARKNATIKTNIPTFIDGIVKEFFL